MSNVRVHIARVEVYVDGVTAADLALLETRLMSVLSDKIAEVNIAYQGALDRVMEDVTALKDRIGVLERLVANGGATAADMAALEELRNRLNALDPHTPETLPPTAPDPTPGPDVVEV